MEDLDRRLMGKRIRDLRQRRGLTQRELAELLCGAYQQVWIVDESGLGDFDPQLVGC